MKTTLDLPDELVRQLKVRAAIDNRRLKDVVAEAIRRGLVSTANAEVPAANKASLPLVRCAHAAQPEEEMTPERVAAVLLAAEAQAVAPGR